MVRKGKAMARVQAVVIYLLIIAMDVIASVLAIKVEKEQSRQVLCFLYSIKSRGHLI
jgi:hypothetical protein